MRRRDEFFLGGAGLLALGVWVRDLAWTRSAGDVVPILAAFPLFYWLGTPWLSTSNPRPISKRVLALGLVLWFLGLGLDLTVLLAGGWTVLLWGWLSARLEPARLARTRKLLVLPFLAFPWVALDAQPLGWFFRLSGAWVTEKISLACGYEVLRHGTQLWLQGQPVSVQAACSGLNGLQSMLIAGSALAFLLLGEHRRYWWNLPWLPAVAWLANTLRILLLSWAAVSISPKFLHGQLHRWSGWLVLVLMFLLCWLLFQWQRPALSRPLRS